MKISSKPAGTLLSISIDNSEIVDSGIKNNEKSAKSDFTKTICKTEEFSFLTLNTR